MPRNKASNSEWSRRVLIAGGHAHICGGLEIFIARAGECLGIEAHCYSETPGRDLRSVGRYVAGLWHFFRMLKNYDIVWLHYGSAFDLAYLVVAKIAGKQVAVTPHLGRNWRAMRIGVLRATSNRLLSAADRVFTLYKAQPSELAFPSALKQRCSVMGTFLPKALLDSGTARPAHSGKLRLIHLARLSAAKGSFAFLEVCDELRRRGISYEATLAGPASSEVLAALQREIAGKNLTVSVLGNVPQEAVMELLHRHDVLVNLSLQDAYPLTVIEALLCGVTPVCARLAGAEELASETQAICLVDGQDAKAAADCILAIDTSTVVTSAAAMRQTFSWASMTARYRLAFTDLATARGSDYSADITRTMPQ